MEKFELKRTKQCKTCPWIKGNKLENIPNYCKTKHKNLKKTIAKDLEYNVNAVQIMSCHYSTDENEQHCIGWLHNQLGVGNNIPLRINMLGCTNASKIKLSGEQVDDFEDTFEKI